ncbi:MAG TPA: aspartate dehydrogenase, partial [Hyphomicrobiales bacterium]|nr:aspartate dehydrogenase [Hyphomicrobiales bacterium]
MRLGIIGCGAVAETLLKGLAAADAPLARLVCLARPQSLGRAEALLATYPPAAERRVVASIHELIRGELDLVVECAGQDALQAFGATVLAAGIDLVPASIGALADEQLHEALRAAAAVSGARLRLPAGAIGGLDLLGAARLAGIDRVTLVSRKPPEAWRGTRAETLVDLGSIASAVTFYRGSARDAARDYPKNANVAAAVALAGAGFEATAVELVADPAARGNSHEITLRSACADLHLRID